MKKLKCEKCKHKWIPRIEKRPVRCPRCGCFKFDEKREKK